MSSVLLFGLFDTAIMTARCFNGKDIDIYGMDYERAHLGFFSRRIKSVEVPDPGVSEESWLEFVLDWLKKSNESFVLIPTSDEFARLCAKYAEPLSEFCSSLVPSYEVIEFIIERDRQFELAEHSGLDVPNFIRGDGGVANDMHSQLQFPMAVKPVNVIEWKRKVRTKGFIVRNMEELSNKTAELDRMAIRYIVQNLVEGNSSNNFEVNSLYLPDGRLIQHTVRKIRQYPDRLGTATCIEPIVGHKLEQDAAAFIKENKITGFSNIEFKFDPGDNRYYYIETNPRVWFQVNYSMKLGINFPLLYYQFLTTPDVSVDCAALSSGKWVDFLPDILFWKRFHKDYSLSLTDFVKSWFPLVSTGLFSFRDPAPFIKDLRIQERAIRMIRGSR